VAAGADGLIIEVDIDLEKVRCDKEQTLTPVQFSEMAQRVRDLHQFMAAQQ
jgi:3-deoxy-7-phosphoheptulonate synthase